MRLIQLAACLFLMSGANAAAPIDVSEFRGRVLYLDFWASWCGPCRQSFPWMEAMKESYGAQGLSVVAVNLDQHRTDAERFIAKFHPTFDVRFDPKGETAERFKVQGMPTGLIIDRQGMVRYTHIGFRPVDRAAYEVQLREVLAGK